MRYGRDKGYVPRNFEHLQDTLKEKAGLPVLWLLLASGVAWK
jgi:hypothetical protein